MCAHKDPGDSGQFQGVCGLQAQSPGLLSRELPSSALWAGHIMPPAPLLSLRPSGRWEKHPAKADGHEAGDLAPQDPQAARLSSCSAPLSGPALPSLQVLQRLLVPGQLAGFSFPVFSKLLTSLKSSPSSCLCCKTLLTLRVPSPGPRPSAPSNGCVAHLPTLTDHPLPLASSFISWSDYFLSHPLF